MAIVFRWKVCYNPLVQPFRRILLCLVLVYIANDIIFRRRGLYFFAPKKNNFFCKGALRYSFISPSAQPRTISVALAYVKHFAQQYGRKFFDDGIEGRIFTIYSSYRYYSFFYFRLSSPNCDHSLFQNMHPHFPLTIPETLYS